MALGILDGATYKTGKLIISSGDGIFYYADGLTEAMDNNGE